MKDLEKHKQHSRKDNLEFHELQVQRFINGEDFYLSKRWNLQRLLPPEFLRLQAHLLKNNYKVLEIGSSFSSEFLPYVIQGENKYGYSIDLTRTDILTKEYQELYDKHLKEIDEGREHKIKPFFDGLQYLDFTNQEEFISFVKDNKYDIIFINHVLQHYGDNFFSLVKLLKEGLNEEGYIIIVDDCLSLEVQYRERPLSILGIHAYEETNNIVDWYVELDYENPKYKQLVMVIRK